MNIEWSKAPEDATHAGVTTGLKIPVFYKDIREDKYSYWYDVGDGWREDVTGNPSCTPLIERPKKQYAWDGVGLPPAGLACEYRKTDAKYRQGFVAVKVLCYGKEKCFLQHEASKNEFTEDLSSVEFRPILTAEQVAAEEREKAIDEMVFGVCGCEPDGGNTSALMVCGFLYDAGYRKQ